MGTADRAREGTSLQRVWAVRGERKESGSPPEWLRSCPSLSTNSFLLQHLEWLVILMVPISGPSTWAEWQTQAALWGRGYSNGHLMLRVVRLGRDSTHLQTPSWEGPHPGGAPATECTRTHAPGRGCPKCKSPTPEGCTGWDQGHPNYSFLGERTGPSPEQEAGGPRGGPGEAASPTSALAICVPGVGRRKAPSSGQTGAAAAETARHPLPLASPGLGLE